MDIVRVRPPDVVDFLDQVARAPKEESNPILCVMMNENERDKLVAAIYSAAEKYDKFAAELSGMSPAFPDIAKIMRGQSADVRAFAAVLNELDG